jgi:hypothetical protein
VSREEDKLQGKEDLSPFSSLSLVYRRDRTKKRREREKRTIPNQSTAKPCAILVERARNSSLFPFLFFSYGRSVIFGGGSSTGTTSQRNNPEGRKRRIYQWPIPNTTTTTTTTTRIISPDKIPSVLIHREKKSSALLAYARARVDEAAGSKEDEGYSIAAAAAYHASIILPLTTELSRRCAAARDNTHTKGEEEKTSMIAEPDANIQPVEGENREQLW